MSKLRLAQIEDEDLGQSGPKARFVMLAGNVSPSTRKQLLLKRVLTRRKIERAGPEPIGRGSSLQSP